MSTIKLTFEIAKQRAQAALAQLSRGLDGVKASAIRADDAIKKSSISLDGWGKAGRTAALGLGAVTAAATATAFGIKTLIDRMGALQSRNAVWASYGRDGVAALQDISEFARVSGLDMDSLIDHATKLGRVWDPRGAAEYAKVAADLSIQLHSGEEGINRYVEAMLKLGNTAALSENDVKSFAEQLGGVPVEDLMGSIERLTGLSGKKLSNAFKQGKVSALTLVDAIKDFGTQGKKAGDAALNDVSKNVGKMAQNVINDLGVMRDQALVEIFTPETIANIHSAALALSEFLKSDDVKALVGSIASNVLDLSRALNGLPGEGPITGALGWFKDNSQDIIAGVGGLAVALSAGLTVSLYSAASAAIAESAAALAAAGATSTFAAATWALIAPFAAATAGIIAIGGAAYLLIRYWEPITEAFSDAGKAVAEFAAKSWDTFKAWGKNVIGFVSSLPATFTRLGGELMDGLILGITGGLRRVTDAVKGVAKGAIDTFKSALGIHSPSKVFAELGVNTVQGYEQGVGKATRTSTSTQVMARKATDEAETVLQELQRSLSGITTNSHPVNDTPPPRRATPFVRPETSSKAPAPIEVNVEINVAAGAQVDEAQLVSLSTQAFDRILKDRLAVLMNHAS